MLWVLSVGCAVLVASKLLPMAMWEGKAEVQLRMSRRSVSIV